MSTWGEFFVVYRGGYALGLWQLFVHKSSIATAVVALGNARAVYCGRQERIAAGTATG